MRDRCARRGWLGGHVHHPHGAFFVVVRKRSNSLSSHGEDAGGLGAAHLRHKSA
jgi:hypothetical protein